jgi:DNA replication licensing factor MCM3
MHRYLPPGVEEGTPIHDNLSQPLSVDGPGSNVDNEAVDTSPFEKYDPLLHIGLSRRTGPQTRSSKPKKILSIPFVKKYIQYAKSKPVPVLSKGAADHIVEVYASLRNEGMEGNKKKVRGPNATGKDPSSSHYTHDSILDFSPYCSYTRDPDPSRYCTCES